MVDTFLAGLIHGNTYALVALGVSLIFGVTRVVSFAQGSVFALGGMIGWWLTSVQSLPLWAAVLVATGAAAAVGALVNAVGVRPFRKMPHVAALLATFAVGLILDNLSRLVFGAEKRSFEELLPTSNLSIGTFRFGTLDIVILAVSLLSMVTLALFLKRSRYGRAIRATAQDSEAAAQMGVPVERVEYMSFVIASALGGLGGVLVGLYNVIVDPTVGVQAGLTAFVAATLGGMGSLPGAVVGGIVLGITEAFGIAMWGDGARNLITFGVLLLVLWLRPSGLLGKSLPISKEPMTGTYLGGGIPLRMRGWHVAVLVAVAAVVLPAFGTGYQLTVGSQVIVYALLGLSLVLVSGLTGQISIGQMGPVAIGAYTAALLATGLQVPFWVGLPLAGILAAALSVVLLLPSWRLSGHYFSIASLGIGFFIVALLLNMRWLTGGAMGISQIPAPEILGYELRTGRDFFFFHLVILLLTIGLVTRLQRSYLGTVFKAVGADAVAVEAAGLRPNEYKSMAYVVGGFIAGIAGALMAYQYTFIDPALFTMDMSVLALTIIVLGAMRSPFGAVQGSLILVGAPEVLRLADDWRLIFYGVVLILLIRFRPQGLWARKLA